MKIRLVTEITVITMLVIFVGVWQGWLKWPEGALMAAALSVVTAVMLLRRVRQKDDSSS